MLPAGTRCPASAAASKNCRSARSKPCMRKSSQAIEHQAGKHTRKCRLFQQAPSAASSYVCPVDDAAESLVVGVVVAPDDVAADHAGLLLVGGVVGAVEGEVAQRGELRLNPVPPGCV